MATLYRHPRSRFWWARFTDRNEERISRSTGKIKKGEARDVAHSLEMEEKRAKQKQQALQKEMVELLNRATIEANKGIFTVEKARNYVMDLYEIVNHEELPSFTVAEWLDKWLENKASDIKAKTMTRYTGSITSVKKALGKSANLRLELFTTQHAQALRQKLIKTQGKARNATVNVRLTDFKSAFTAAYEQQLIQYNVGLAIKYLPEDDSKIVTHFEPEEVQQLMRATDRKDWKLAILLAAETGLRLSDVVGLKVESVKLDRGCLIVSPKKQMRAKNKKTIIVPINEITMKRIEKFCSPKSLYLFPYLAERTSSTHSTNFNNLMKRAKFTKQVKLDNGDTGHRSFHSLRHSFATWLLKADVEKDVRKSLMAHSSDDVHEIYAAHDESTLRRAIETLPKLVA